MIHKASEDRAGLDFALPDALFGFHAQQAVEKLLKALIAFRGSQYAHTHDLRQLRTRCIELGEVLPELPWNPADLQIYAVDLRYDWTDPVPETARQKMRDAVDILMEFVLERAHLLGSGE